VKPVRERLPLVEAVISGDDESATAAWRLWRSGIDIEHIAWHDVLLVSMVAADRLRRWVAGDSAAGILTGVARRNRAQSTLRSAVARRLAADLVAAGGGPVMLAGPVAMFLHGGGDAVRPITEIHLLLPRPAVPLAADILARSGWRATGPGRPAAADWDDHLVLACDGLLLRMQWRHLPVPPWRARGCEARLFTCVAPVLPREPLLASVLARGDDGAMAIPWQVDAALLLRQPVDWGRVLEDTAGLPAVASRLEELRGIGLPVPAGVCRAWAAVGCLEAAADRMVRRSVRAGRAWREGRIFR
jgi:hypothetical protein